MSRCCLFVGPTGKQSSGPSCRRGGPLYSPLGRVKQGQRLLFPHWASKPPDWGLFCTGPLPSTSLWSWEENCLQLPEAGRSPGFSPLLQNLLVHFLQRLLVAAETSPGWPEECHCAIWLSGAYLHQLVLSGLLPGMPYLVYPKRLRKGCPRAAGHGPLPPWEGDRFKTRSNYCISHPSAAPHRSYHVSTRSSAP